MTEKKLKPCVGICSLASPLEVGADRAPKAAAELADVLKKLGCEVVEIGVVGTAQKASEAGKQLAEKHVHAIAFAAVSWYEDYLVTDLLEECNVPILLWSLPGMETGALCGTQQLTAYLRQLEYRYACVYGGLDDKELQTKAKQYLQAAALYKKLRTARIGLAGHRVAGMTEVASNEIMLKKAFGPRVVHLAMPKMLEKMNTVSDADAKKEWKQLTSRSACCKVDEDQGLQSIKMYMVIREIIEKEILDAMTFGCYPDWMGVACIASSILADEGIPVGCEGDVNGATGQLILTRLTGQPTHNTDWLEPMKDGTIVFTHCGSGSFDLAEDKKDITLSPVRLANTGVCALFPAKPGIVTMINLMPQADGYQIAMLKGEAISTEMVFPGNPLRVKFDRGTKEIIEWIHEEGIGHHWMAGYGDVTNEVRNLVSMSKHCRVVE